LSVDEVYGITKIDPWFLTHLQAIVDSEEKLRGQALGSIDAERMRGLKMNGISDRRIGQLTHSSTEEVRTHRKSLGVTPVYKRGDPGAAGFGAPTPYLYSTYEPPLYFDGKPVVESEAAPTDRKKVVILGGGPNRIGQGIEFDYCCVHAVMALREEGFETIMV